MRKAGVACLENEKELLAENRGVWKRRMGVAGKGLREAGFRFAEPQSPMYFFATHEGIAGGAGMLKGFWKRGWQLPREAGLGNMAGL